MGTGPRVTRREEAFSPYLPGGYDHAVFGADVTLAPLNLCVETLDGVRNHSWRRPAPATPEGEVVAWADRIAYVCHDFEDAMRAGILMPDDLPDEVADVGRAQRCDRSGVRRTRCSTASTRTGRVAMTEPAATALAAFRAFNFDRIYLRPARCARPSGSIALLRGLVDYFIDAPIRLPRTPRACVADLDAGTPETAAAVAVRYVSRDDRSLRARPRRRAARLAPRAPAARCRDAAPYRAA